MKERQSVMIGSMSLMIWIGVGAAFAVAVGIRALVRKRQPGDVKDLGSMGGQWIAEQRIHERGSSSRWG